MVFTSAVGGNVAFQSQIKQEKQFLESLAFGRRLTIQYSSNCIGSQDIVSTNCWELQLRRPRRMYLYTFWIDKNSPSVDSARMANFYEKTHNFLLYFKAKFPRYISVKGSFNCNAGGKNEKYKNYLKYYFHVFNFVLR